LAIVGAAAPGGVGRCNCSTSAPSAVAARLPGAGAGIVIPVTGIAAVVKAGASISSGAAETLSSAAVAAGSTVRSSSHNS
jgi:hypothetical protein